MAGIFISYRRDDSRHAAGRLGDDLAEVFGSENLFRDVESIAPGVDFEAALGQALKACAVMLVVIGPRWLNIADAQGRRRLDQPGDWIRAEVAEALRRDVRLIPVLLEDTPLPDAAELPEELRPLLRRQTLPLSDGRWRGDLQRLVETLERIPGLERRRGPTPPPPPPPPEPTPAPAPKPASKKGLWTGVALGAGGLLLVSALIADPPAEPGPSPAPSPAPSPSPAPAPAPAPPPTLMPPEQLKALADRVLQGRWQAENDPVVFIDVEQIGERVSVRFHANGTAVGQGQGRFDGQRLVLQAQAGLFGQTLMQGECHLQWDAAQQRLSGTCLWPSGNEATVWAKRS